MAREDQIKILCSIATRDDAGRHFTELYDADDLIYLVTEGLIAVDRPIHEPSGIMFDRDQWSVKVTEEGQALVDANPDLYPAANETDSLREEISAAVEAADVCCPEQVCDACIAVAKDGGDWRAELTRAKTNDPSERRALGIDQ